MSKKITKKQDTELATENKYISDVEFDAGDLVVPKVLAMQGMSDMVTSGRAQVGELRDSLTGDLLGSVDAPMEFIPISIQKTFQKYEYVDGMKMFRGVEAFDSSLPWKDGDIERDLCYNVLVILENKIESGFAMPYLITFKRTSSKAGKILMMEFQRQRAVGNPLFMSKWKLHPKIMQKNRNNYIVTDVSKEEAVSEEVVSICEKSFETFARSFRADDSDLNTRVNEANKMEKKDISQRNF